MTDRRQAATATEASSSSWDEGALFKGGAAAANKHALLAWMSVILGVGVRVWWGMVMPQKDRSAHSEEEAP